ncbi:hypothetical protein GQ44DRAFT_773908 [Phaeosphaeriaceae sp. PMI808]|nr:hypothetical protein GQ44DRAFT_773908 [Phaeosphaeriaceae sp. PMI808]
MFTSFPTDFTGILWFGKIELLPINCVRNVVALVGDNCVRRLSNVQHEAFEELFGRDYTEIRNHDNGELDESIVPLKADREVLCYGQNLLPLWNCSEIIQGRVETLIKHRKRCVFHKSLPLDCSSDAFAPGEEQQIGDRNTLSEQNISTDSKERALNYVRTYGQDTSKVKNAEVYPLEDVKMIFHIGSLWNFGVERRGHGIIALLSGNMIQILTICFKSKCEHEQMDGVISRLQPSQYKWLWDLVSFPLLILSNCTPREFCEEYQVSDNMILQLESGTVLPLEGFPLKFWALAVRSS